MRPRSWLTFFAAVLALLAATSAFSAGGSTSLLSDHSWSRMIFGLMGFVCLKDTRHHGHTKNEVWNLPFITLLAAFEVLVLIHSQPTEAASYGLYYAIAATWLASWRVVDILVASTPKRSRLTWVFELGVPVVFGLTLVYLWEVLTLALGVPKVILPAPSAVLFRLFSTTPILLADLIQTSQGLFSGYLIGCGAGFLTAIIIDEIPFLKRGLLPLGNLVSALPIVGIAPIMVMWFGFDWPSKAAVVVVMTFFPMLVNTVAGLSAAGPMERDLMKTYGATASQTLISLRLPAALPFIFNGLKINTTLALIGAIVAEFFGTPIVGMGFRINTEVGRMNIDMVWATIVVAALVGSLFYGFLAQIERRVTFWHASYRQGAA